MAAPVARADRPRRCAGWRSATASRTPSRRRPAARPGGSSRPSCGNGRMACRTRPQPHETPTCPDGVTGSTDQDHNPLSSARLCPVPAGGVARGSPRDLRHGRSRPSGRAKLTTGSSLTRAGLSCAPRRAPRTVQSSSCPEEDCADERDRRLHPAEAVAGGLAEEPGPDDVHARRSDSWRLEMPVMPRALSGSSTDRVEPPWMQACRIAAVSTGPAIGSARGGCLRCALHQQRAEAPVLALGGEQAAENPYPQVP